MIAIVNYGCGNLFSLTSSLERLGISVSLASTPEDIAQADKVILPGVGAFEFAVTSLKERNLWDAILTHATADKPMLGICLGMQLLFESSEEFGNHRGLGLINGDIVGFEGKVEPTFNIPHINWSKLNFTDSSNPFFAHANGKFVYFVHSLYAQTDAKNIIATCSHGVDFPAIVRKGNIWGMQFHPEKSGEIGQEILRTFVNI